MKKITLLLLLFVSLASFGQDKSEFKVRTKYADEFVTFISKLKKKNNPEAYAFSKIKGINGEDNVVIELDNNQKSEMTDLFIKQYPEFKTAYDKYLSDKGSEAKTDLIKVLLKHEDEFRKLLSEKQNIYYRSYDPAKNTIKNTEFQYYFMTDIIYWGYKKELL